MNAWSQTQPALISSALVLLSSLILEDLFGLSLYYHYSLAYLPGEEVPSMNLIQSSVKKSGVVAYIIGRPGPSARLLPGSSLYLINS